MPLPIVVDGEMVFTLEGAMTYVQLLRRILQLYEKDPRHGVHHDSGDFLRLVVDHIQLFERHWRKMVVDLRQGELNRHVNIPKKARIVYLSTVMPRPALALKLDTAFRNLGFHMKVLGKDIVLRGFATLKKPKQTTQRRPSFPENVLGSSGFQTVDFSTTRDSMASNMSSGDSRHVTFTPVLNADSSDSRPLLSASLDSGLKAWPKAGTLKHYESTPLPLSAETGTSADFGFTSMTGTTGTQGTTGTFNTAPHSRSAATGSRKAKKMSKMEALVQANTVGSAAMKEMRERMTEKEERGATANRHNLVRRGSDTDVVRPSSMEELRKIEHTLKTDPRTEYHNLIAVGGRFICPFPACGQSYTSRDAAFDHLKIHEQRRRLYAPSPMADSHMNFYWPRDNSWRDDPKYTHRVVPPGSIKCKEKGCMEVFMSQHRLEYHMKLVHKQESKSFLLQSFFKFQGKNTATPPYPTPPYAPADFCSNHLKLEKKCPKCSVLMTKDIPKQPMNFYDSVRVDFTKRDGKGGVILVERAGGDKGLYCTLRDEDGRERVIKGRPVGMLKDFHGDGWVAVQEVVTIVEAQEKRRRVPKDGDVHYEVVQLLESDGSGTLLDPGAPTWVRLVDVSGYFYLIESTKDDFRFRLRNGEIPKDNVYFIRPGRVPITSLKQAGEVSRPVTPVTPDTATHTPGDLTPPLASLPPIGNTRTGY